MANPIQVPTIRPPVVTPQQPNVVPYISLIMSALQQSHDNRMTRAKNAMADVQEGTTYSALSKEQQDAFRYLTGRKNVSPDEVVNPLTGDEAALDRLAPPGTPLHDILRTTMAARVATGQPQGPITEAGLQAQTSANVASAQLRATNVNTLQSAVAKVNAGHSDQMTDGERAVYQQAYNFIPSDIQVQHMSNAMKMSVIQEGQQLLTDPRAAAGLNTLLAQYGTHEDPVTHEQVANVTVGNLVGAFATGIGSAIDQTLAGFNASMSARADMQDLAYKANLNVAEAAAKSMGSRYSATFVLSVMEGDPRALRTPAGQAAQALLNAGYNASMADLAEKGNPGAVVWQQIQGLLRIPGVASDPNTLSAMANMLREQYASTITQGRLGPRPDSEGPAQTQWDNFRAGILRGIASYTPHTGLFGTGMFRGGIKGAFNGTPAIEPNLPTPSDVLPTGASPSDQERLNLVNTLSRAIQLGAQPMGTSAGQRGAGGVGMPVAPSQRPLPLGGGR